LAVAAVLSLFPSLRQASADTCPAMRVVLAESADFDRVSIDTVRGPFVAAKGAPRFSVLTGTRSRPVRLWISFDDAARTAPTFSCWLAPSRLAGGTYSIAELCDCGASSASEMTKDGGGDARAAVAGDHACAELTIPQSDDAGDYVRVDLAPVAGEITLSSTGDPFDGEGTVTATIDIPATSVADDRGAAHALEIRAFVGREQVALQPQSCPSSGGCDCGGPGKVWRPGGG
jgi:hypothetical protein